MQASDPTQLAVYLQAAHRTSPDTGRILARAFGLSEFHRPDTTADSDPSRAVPFAAGLSISLIHSALGLASECFELSQATSDVNLKEESGDLSWFTAEGAFLLAQGILAHSKGADIVLPELSPIPPYCCPLLLKDEGVQLQGGKTVQESAGTDLDRYLRRLFCIVGRITSTVKDFVFYGKERINYSPDDKNKDTMEPILLVLHRHLMVLFGHLEEMAPMLGTSFAEVLDSNIRKLRARFPDKFSEAEALNRDYTREEAALLGGSDKAVAAVVAENGEEA